MQKMTQKYLKQRKLCILNTKEFSFYMTNRNDVFHKHKKFKKKKKKFRKLLQKIQHKSNRKIYNSTQETEPHNNSNVTGAVK